MAGLGETIDRLARQRRADEAQRVRIARAPVRPASGQIVQVKSFGDNPGALRMFLHAPARLPKGAPMVVVLHGCGQGAEQYARDGGWLSLAGRLGFAVLAPEQVIFNNFNRCFNWFAPDDAARGRGEAASIAAMVAYAVGDLELDPQCVFISGLSAGGAMASVLLATYPELFAGGAIIAGVPFGVARGMQDGLRLMRKGAERGPEVLGELARKAAPGPRPPLRLSVWQGDADAVVNPVNGREIADQWVDALGLPPEPVEDIALPHRRRLVWRGPTGGSIVELNLIANLGHGAPLSTLKAGDVGAPAPYMLEAGVSSTLESAGFWGLEPAPAAGVAAPAVKAKVKVKAKAKAKAKARATAPKGDLLGGVRRGVVKALRALGRIR